VTGRHPAHQQPLQDRPPRKLHMPKAPCDNSRASVR